MWRQANVAKVGLHFESILIRGLMEYAFWTPNGSPEYRYCLHEAVEECNHTMMFQEMVNRIGADVPGMPRLLKWVQPLIPLVAGPLPIPFWFGILAGEEPIDHTQKNVLREGKTLHPIMERVMAIHVAEEARHISFAHEYLRKRVPHLPRRKRFWLSLYVPLIMRVLCSAIIVPPRAFWKEFDIPRSVRKEIFFRSPESRQMLRDMFGDVRMLCHDTGLMNPVAKLMWRICRIDGTAQPVPQRARSASTWCRPRRDLMPHVITQSCCSDGSCVYACPVNCIHPSPDEPGFATAEMLYIDPVACVDCGACVSACPVGAIAPDTRLDRRAAAVHRAQRGVLSRAARGEKLPPTSKLAPVIEAPKVAPAPARSADGGDRRLRARRDVRRRRAADPAGRAGQRLRTAADALRAGARGRGARSPEHQAGHPAVRPDRPAARASGSTSTSRWGRICRTPNCCAHHHAVLYAVGAPNDRRLDIDGIGLPGTATATEMVAWINGHPEFADLPVDLSHERVVVVGNGNVALDVARILTTDPDALARTDIADHALAALRGSGVQRGGDRGPARPGAVGVHAARADRADVDVRRGARRGRPRPGAARPRRRSTDPLTRNKLEILRKLGDASAPVDAAADPAGLPPDPAPRRSATSGSTGIEFTVTGTDEVAHGSTRVWC